MTSELPAAESPDAVFAKSLDRFQPPVLNLHSEGGSWPDYDVTEDQVRIALTERLGFLATTDGYAFTEFDSVLPSEEGFADLAVGLKYAIHYDPAEGEILTLGARYTIPTGNLDVGG